MTPEQQQRAIIRRRLANCGDAFGANMNSACGEYNCDCHRDMPGILDAFDAADAEIARLRAKNTELNRRWQAADAAVRSAQECIQHLDKHPWCGGNLGRAFLAYHASELQKKLDAADAELARLRTALVPFSDADRRRLKPGDRVLVTDDRGNDAEYIVKYAPWQLGHGAWVIGLNGITGGYALERVVRLIEAAPEEKP